MTVHLDPLIAQKLESFASRRRSLIVRRGAYAAVLSLIVSMCVVTLIDWLFILSETARWVLSSSAYLTVLGVVWVTCLRLILRVPSPARMARLIESAQPELREDLISAVELGDPSTAGWTGVAGVPPSAMFHERLDPTADACRLAKSTGDSPAFRSLLQQDVAKRVTRMNVTTLLPARLVQRWLVGAGLAVATCLVLLVWPRLYFAQRIGRALLPMADIERVALTKIAIVHPNPASVVVPQGEPLPVTVELAGPECKDKVTLETFRKGQGRQQVVMASDNTGGRRFTATVRVDHELLRYRVRANDGHTKTHVITARPRPQVVAFQKTFDYPAYLQMTATTETDRSGDLVAVEGTRVDVVIETSEAIASSHLSIDKGGVVETVALELDPGRAAAGARADRASSKHLRGSVVLDRSGTYRVHLVSADTGFENKFSPDYALTAELDSAPTIRIAEPAPVILAPPDEIVTLRGRAEDDWALDRIEQHTQINKGHWQVTSLVVFDKRVREHSIEHPWDLYPLRLEAGDELNTKLVAIDRKGNRKESDPIRVIISSAGFDPQRLHRLTAVRRANDALVELANQADSVHQSVDAALTSRKAADGARVQQQVASATDSVRRFDAECTRASDVLKSAVQIADGSRESCDLVLANGLAAGAAAKATSSLHPLLDQMAASTAAAQPADVMTALAADSDTVRRTSRAARDLFGTLAAGDHMALVGMDLIDTSMLFHRAIDHARSSRLATDLDAQRLGRAELATASALQVLLGVLDDGSSLVDVGTQRQVEGIRQQLASIKSSIEGNGPSGAARNAAAQGTQPVPEVLSNLTRIDAQISDSLGQMAGLLRETMGSSDKAWRQMADAEDAFHDLAFESLGHARRFVEMKRGLSERAARGDLDTLERDAQATKWQRDRTRIALETAVAWLKSYADFAEARPIADYHLVNDLSHASQAIAAVADPVLQGGDGEAPALADLERIASAVRVLGVIERLDDLTASVRSLADLERSGADVPNRAQLLVANPHNWSWCGPQYESLARKLAHVSANAVQMLTESRASAEYETVSVELRSRLNPANMQASVGRQPIEPPEKPHRRRAETHRMPESPETPQPRWADAPRSTADTQTPLRLVPSEAAKLALDLSLIRQELQQDLNNARSVLDRLAIPLSRMIAEAAQAARQVEQATNRLAQDAGSHERDENQAEAREQLAMVQDLARSLEDIRDALRRDANDQDIFNSEDRQRARDDDDALALLDQQPRAVERALRDAVVAADPAHKQQALTEATRQEADLSRTLEQLAEHFANVERGDPAATRPALRDIESELGVRDRLDQQHGRLDRLATLAESDPQRALSALERELAANPPMQHALQRIAREAVEQAQADLERAAQQQRGVSQNGEQSAEEAQLAEQLAEIGWDAQRLVAARVAPAVEATRADHSPTDREASGTERNADSESSPDDAGEVRPAQRVAQAMEQLAQAAALAQRDPEQDSGRLSERAAAVAQSLQQAALELRRANETDRTGAIDQSNPHHANAGDRATPTRRASEGASTPTRRASEAESTLTRRASEGPVPRESPANDAPPADPMPTERAQNAVQRAAEQAADAARQARQALEAAEQAQQVQPSNDARLAAVQQAAERIAQAAAARAVEAAAEAIEQAEAASEAAQAASQDSSAPAPQQARNAQQAELAASRAGQAAQQAAAASQQAQDAAQLAHDPQPAAQLAADAARQAEALARQAERLANRPDSPSEIARAVEQAARDVARAARNEARLGHQQHAAELSEAAAAIDAAADIAEMGQHSNDAGTQAASDRAAAQEAIETQARHLAELASHLGNQASESAADPMAPLGMPARDGMDSVASGRPESQPGAQGPASASSPEPRGSSPSGNPVPARPGAPGSPTPPNNSQPSPSESRSPSQGTPESSNAGTPIDSTAADNEVAERLACALDQLDARTRGQTGASNGQASTSESATESGSAAPSSPTSSESSPALAAAARAQGQAMAAARSGNRQQGHITRSVMATQSSSPIGQGFVELSGGAGVASRGMDFEPLPEIQDLTKRDWGKLPPKLAQDLLEGSRESVSPEYRSAIETYFRVIAQKARQRKE
jgi:hypothetical protein